MKRAHQWLFQSSLRHSILPYKRTLMGIVIPTAIPILLTRHGMAGQPRRPSLLSHHVPYPLHIRILRTRLFRSSTRISYPPMDKALYPPSRHYLKNSGFPSINGRRRTPLLGRKAIADPAAKRCLVLSHTQCLNPLMRPMGTTLIPMARWIRMVLRSGHQSFNRARHGIRLISRSNRASICFDNIPRTICRGLWIHI